MRRAGDGAGERGGKTKGGTPYGEKGKNEG